MGRGEINILKILNKYLIMNAIYSKENGFIEENVIFRVDEFGFFLYWQPEGKVAI